MRRHHMGERRILVLTLYSDAAARFARARSVRDAAYPRNQAVWRSNSVALG